MGICDDVGACWHTLGIRLRLPADYLNNMEGGHRRSCEKARDMLRVWKEKSKKDCQNRDCNKKDCTKKECYATVHWLVNALETIGKHQIAQKLLGTYVLTFLLILTIILQLRNQSFNLVSRDCFFLVSSKSRGSRNTSDPSLLRKLGLAAA